MAGSKSVRIATNCFTAEEVDLCRRILESKFGLQTTKQLLTKKGVILLRTNILFILKLLLFLN